MPPDDTPKTPRVSHADRRKGKRHGLTKPKYRQRNLGSKPGGINQHRRSGKDNYEVVPITRDDGAILPGVRVGLGETRIVRWAPQPGSQQAFLSCPVREALYEGTRGPGKSDALIMDYCQDVGKGLGEDWNGILFRESYPQLDDVIAKCRKWIPQVWPRAQYNKADHVWTWPDGERLSLRHMDSLEDYQKYHGFNVPWLGWEELTLWPTDEMYKMMFSVNRSTNPKVRPRIRATCNPSGVGHGWVKQRFNLPIAPHRVVGDIIPGEYDAELDLQLPDRVAIHGDFRENLILLQADPSYGATIAASATSEAQRRAWLYGDWDVVAGGMFDDVWNPKYHVLPTFDLRKIPQRWRLDRSYDHGQSKPFSVGWWAESNGECPDFLRRLPAQPGSVKGDVIRIMEWYGWSGKANEGVRMLSADIARSIRAREVENLPNRQVLPGPADSSIFDRHDGQKSVAGEMAKAGVAWSPALKGPGSREHGWEQVRKYLAGAVPPPPPKGKPDEPQKRETPGLFILETCHQFLRTVPVLPRDKRRHDDVDSDAEDHVGDEVRYRLRAPRRVANSDYGAMIY